MSWCNNDKGFGFALSAWFIVASGRGCVSGVSLTLTAFVVGNGSYILWPLVVLTLGYDRHVTPSSRQN